MIRTTFVRRCGLPLVSVFRRQSQAQATVLRPADLRAAMFQPSFDLNKMTDLLDHDNHEMRKRFRQFVSEPVMIPRYNIPLLEERDVALQRLQVHTCTHHLALRLIHTERFRHRHRNV